MRKQIVDVGTGAELGLAEPCHDYPKQRRKTHRDFSAETSGVVIAFPCPSVRAKKKAGLLAELEAENAALRHRAVELALQIQETHERRR